MTYKRIPKKMRVDGVVEQGVTLSILIAPSLLKQLDDWRLAQPIPPSKASLVRYLLEQGIKKLPQPNKEI